MAILTEGEIYDYASISSGADVNTLISAAEVMVYGSAGANWNLEKQERTEQRTVGFLLQTLQLSYWPVYPAEPVFLEGRFGNLRSRYRYPIGVSQWESLSANSYFLDNNGHLSLNTENSISNFDRRTTNGCITEIKIRYQAGIDFSINTRESIELKTAFALIVSALSTEGMNALSGVQEAKRESYLEGSIQYMPAQGTKKTLNDFSPGVFGVSDFLLAPFRKYRSRGLY